MELVHGILENAIIQRGRPYQEMFAVSVRFEADETSADKDQQIFFSLVKCINIPLAANHPQSLVIRTDDVHPGWTVSFFLERLLDVISTCDGRSLLILHYAGHGGLNADGELTFFAQVPGIRSFKYTNVIDRTLVDCSECNTKRLERTDVVIILDGCFSGNVIRAIPQGERTVEILAAVSANQLALGNPSLSGRNLNRTFTARLAGEVAIKRGREEKSFVLSDIISGLRCHGNAQRLPMFETALGSMAIRIPLKARTGNESIPSRPPRGALGSSESSELQDPSRSTDATPNLRVIFTLHIDRTPDDNDLQSLVRWVQALDPFHGLELTSIHLSRPTLLTFSALWRVWASLKGLPCFSFVSEVFGENLLVRSSFSQVAVPTAQTGLKELKSENINPNQIRAAEPRAQTGLKESKSENINPHQIRAAGPKAKVEGQ